MTFWTESSGYAAALKTLEIMKKKRSWIYISRIGKYIKSKWLNLAKKHNIKINVSGQNSIPYLKFVYPNNSEILTYFTQEMLKKNFLAGSQVATTNAYNYKIINRYLKVVDKVFKKINLCLRKKKFPLKGEIKHSTFKRLTG